MQIAQQNTKRISNPAIGVAEAGKDFFRERHVGRVIDAAGPKPQQIGAILADEMIGSRRFFVRAGFGNLFSVDIDYETMCDASSVRGAIIERDACHQR